MQLDKATKVPSQFADDIPAKYMKLLALFELPDTPRLSSFLTAVVVET